MTLLLHALEDVLALLLLAGAVWLVTLAAVEAVRAWWRVLRLARSEDHTARLTEQTLRQAFSRPDDADDDEPPERPPAA